MAAKLDVIVEEELLAKLDEASVNLDLFGGTARHQGEFTNTTISALNGGIRYPGFRRVYEKEQQPLREKTLIELLEPLVMKGVIKFSDAYKEAILLDTAKIMEYWVNVHEQTRDPTLVDELDSLLAKLGKNTPTPIKQIIGGMRFGLEKGLDAYRRPTNIAANFPANPEEMLVLAYYYKQKGGTEGIGMTTESMRNFQSLKKELNLFHNPEALMVYVVAHELEHRRNPPPKDATEEELWQYECEIRESLYWKFELKSKDSGLDKKKYSELARVAHEFAYGHNRVGQLSRVASDRLLERRVLDKCLGRYSPDARGDEIYSGPAGVADYNKQIKPPSKGSAAPSDYIAYMERTGQEPLKTLEPGNEQGKIEPAHHEPGIKTERQYQSGSNCPGRTESKTTESAQTEAAQHETGD